MNNIAQLPVVFWSQSGDSLIASNVIDKEMKRLEMDYQTIQLLNTQ